MTQIELQRRLEEKAKILREYADSDATRAAVGFLIALADLYREELVTVTEANLQGKQACVKQCMAIVSLIDGPIFTNGHI